ncbi:MAG TPA: DUF3105 domain-containing protein [Chloroflexia bacterium]|nr:DUF3105 domain-containing protein [Chloroflexia bacterium]
MSKQRTPTRSERPRRGPAPAPMPVAAPVVDAERKATRLARQEQARAAAARRRRNAQLRTWGIVAAIVLVIGGAAFWAASNEASKPGESVPQQASGHIGTIDTPHAEYSTQPPTSGPHVSEVPPWGISPTQIRDELLVHALEDKGVVISYRPDLDAETVSKLARIVETYGSEVILTPYKDLSTPIAVTAWTRIQRFAQFDEAGLRRFIDAYRGIDHHGQSGS